MASKAERGNRADPEAQGASIGPSEPPHLTGARRGLLRAPSPLLAALLVVATLAAGAGLVALEPWSPPTGAVPVSLSVEGPSFVLHRGTVHAGNALAALLSTNLTVDVVEYPNGAYVRSVEGHTAQGACGWLYSVNGEHLLLSADRATLSAGDSVLWYWGCADA